MKYYLYISDSKLEMLLSQIPHEVKKTIAAEFKIDFKLLSASRKSETESEDNRFNKLEAVLSFIREYGNLGSIDEPDEYIEDELPMRWGAYGWRQESPLVYFGGVTDKTILGLGGSAKHVIGNAGESRVHSHSATANLVFYLQKELGLSQQEQSHQFVLDGEQEEISLAAVYLATSQMDGPLQRVEFVAKRLLAGPIRRSSKQILLATPLYVAMVQ